ncbi:MAG: translation initiation factor IF-2 [Rhodothermales bacterium]
MPDNSTKATKPVRLFKALRELNVSVDTLVDTLKESGFELDKKLEQGDINAKLPPEMYDALRSVFAEDMDARARVSALRSRRRQEEQADAPAPPPAPVATGDSAPSVEPPEVEPAPEPVAEEPEPEVEIVEEPVAEAEPVIELPEEEEEPVAEAEPVIKAKAKPEPVEAEESEAEEEAPVAKSAAKAKPAPTPEPEDEPEDVEAPAAESAEPVAEEETPAEAEDVEELVAEADDDEDDEASTLRADRYELTGTKVIGKIDLSGIESGRRRKRKRKTEEPVSDDDTDSSSRSKRGKRTKKKGKVDKAEAASTVQETLQKLAQGSGRGRQKRRRDRREERAEQREREMEELREQESQLRVMEFISTGELATMMDVPATDVIQTGFGLGMMVSINQRLDADAITLIADEYGFDVEFVTDVGMEDIEVDEDDPEDLVSRPPVVTIMGHVDHGKTSLLDYIREASVASGEAGGITQHIGAYTVETKDGRPITFLDTPGHEAFTAMRARGAQVTDLVILVVAADDQVMPQTKEAINHSKAAGVPIVVAINKMDREEANPDRIMQQLSEENVLVEQYGGQVQSEFVSAKTGMGIPELLEKVLIEAELLELEANPDRYAVGSVIESRLDKGRGVVATILVENGTLEVGDAFVAGTHSGRVRAMFNERDERVEEAGPSRPVQILGFSGAPQVGDRFVVLEDEREAREIAQKRQQIQREQTMRKRKHVSLDDISRRMALGELTYLNLIIKGDVAGSVEAISDALLKISNDEVAVDIVHSGVGAITETDVMLAAASDAIIFGFQVRPMAGVRQIAEREEIDIRLYSVIYDAIEDVRDALEGLLAPEEKEKTLGMLEVRETFKIPKVGTVAGCYVLEGKIRRNDQVRLVREGVVVYEGLLSSLKRFKDDVREVTNGYECGLSIQNFNDIKVSDQIEAYEVVEEQRKLQV